MNKFYFGDNLEILCAMSDKRFHLASPLECVMPDSKNHNTPINPEEFIRLATQMGEREKAESRLYEQINEFKKDLNERINRLEKRLQWIVTIAVAVTSIVAAIIVKFL